MTLLRRLIARAFYVGFFAALGTVVFLYVRHSPRCIITSPVEAMPLTPVQLSADGARLVVIKSNRHNEVHGPLQVWDVRSGRIAHEFLGENESRFTFFPSSDGRYGAAALDDGTMRLFELRTGEAWRLEAPTYVDFCHFSPHGRWLMANTRAGVVLIDPATRQIALRLESSEVVDFSPDESLVFARGSDKKLSVWDVPAKNRAGALETEIPKALTSPDRATAVTWLLDDESDRAEAIRGHQKIPERGLDVWGLPNGVKRWRHRFPVAGIARAIFSPDSKVLATWLERNDHPTRLELLDVSTGQKLWDLPIEAGDGGEFSPDSTIFWFSHGDKHPTLTMWEVATGRKLWERRSPGWGLTGFVHFVGGAGILVHQDDAGRPLLFLDAHTGTLKATGPLNFRAIQAVFKLTPDKRCFLAGGLQVRDREPFFWDRWLEKWWPLFAHERDCLVVMESATGRELFRIVNGGKDGHFLSDDGGTVVTVDQRDGSERVVLIRVWDVAPQRAWAWALATAALLAALWSLGSRALRRLRARSKVQRGPPNPAAA